MGGVSFFGPRCVDTAIIMPPLMLQWSPLHITVLSLAAIASTGLAAAAPFCLSQQTPPVAQSPTATPTAPAEPQKEEKPSGAIDIHADHATVGVDGNASLQGNVAVL